MGNTSRAATGRGLTNTGQRVVARTRPPRAVSVAVPTRTRTRRPRRAGERERALRHIASSSQGRRSKNQKIMQLMAKIRAAIQKLRQSRANKKSG